MNHEEFKIAFSEIIKKSSQKTLRDFAFDICLRLKSDYINFSEITGFGNSEKLETILSEIQTRPSFTNAEIENNISELENICPDTDDYKINEVSYALNSITSTIDYLNFIKTENLKNIENISSYILDSLDFKIENIEKNISDLELENHPKIINEKDRQLKFLSNGL